MDPVDTEAKSPDLLTLLSLTLGQVRAEYSADETIFGAFSWPVYWGELVGMRPCILVGGRGTGKTTTLRGLSYGGQQSLRGSDIKAWDTIGAYWRVDSMVVSAFSGRGLSDADWTAAFSHYTNLKLLSLYLGFREWLEKNHGHPQIVNADALQLTATSLNIPLIASLPALAIEVRRALALLEARLNGATSELMSTQFSLLGRPLAYLLDGISADDPTRRLPFTFCIDEFENLRPYQQRVLNTLIKHVGDSGYTFKVGVREAEERERATLAAGQQLIDPADYTTIDIVAHLKDQSFVDFASQVCERRLHGTPLASLKMTEAFPALTYEEEAVLLDAEKTRLQIRRELLKADVPAKDIEKFDGLAILSACMVGYWARAQTLSHAEALELALSDPRGWEQRVGNHGYAMLFTFRRGRRGIRKYYTGWSTLCQLANGNIRLLLELTYEGLRMQLAESDTPSFPVSYANQTAAASAVGHATLRELQGQSGIGGQLTRLTLSLGRIFNVFASTPEGHTPEVNQISVVGTSSLVPRTSELDSLIREAIANGCLLAFPANKQERDSAETKAPDYQLHPIFAAYFIYSHRRKRKMHIRDDQLLALASEQAPRALDEIIKDRRRSFEDLPDQLFLYSDFYDARD